MALRIIVFNFVLVRDFILFPKFFSRSRFESSRILGVIVSRGLFKVLINFEVIELVSRIFPWVGTMYLYVVRSVLEPPFCKK